MNEDATELLELFEENKKVYENLYISNSNFKSDIDCLRLRLALMEQGSNKYPYDEIEYDLGRYYVRMYDQSSASYDDGFWQVVYDVRTSSAEISDDFKYFKFTIGNRVNEYDVERKVLKR